MTLEINNINLSQYVDCNNNIVITPKFLETHNLIKNGKIKINKILNKKGKELAINIVNVDLKIKIKNCSFKSCLFENCILKELFLLSKEAAERNEIGIDLRSINPIFHFRETPDSL
jgi:hypothetical protein